MSTFQKMSFGEPQGPMSTMELTMGPEEAKPVIRALMRAEAACLLEDADSDDPTYRTPEQRMCDAFLDVVTQTSRCLREQTVDV